MSSEWPDEWGRPGSDWVRPGDSYSEWRGEWFSSSMSGRGGVLHLYATAAQRTEFDWVRDTANASGTVLVFVGEITRLISTRSFVRYRGRRAELMAVVFPGEQRRGWVDRFSPDALAGLEFTGDDYEWASALPGFEARDAWHPYGYGVGGRVPLSEVSDFSQEITEHPVPTGS